MPFGFPPESMFTFTGIPRFIDLCEKMKKSNPSINPDDLWQKAQAAVFQELVERPEALDRLEKFAEEELRPQLGLD